MLASHLPPDAPLMLALSDGESMWGLAEQLLAEAVDTLHAANWQRGGKGRRPKRIPRPGVGSRDVEQLGGTTTYTVDEMRALLDRERAGGGEQWRSTSERRT